jgi:hypothetical protein
MIASNSLLEPVYQKDDAVRHTGSTVAHDPMDLRDTTSMPWVAGLSLSPLSLSLSLSGGKQATSVRFFP